MTNSDAETWHVRSRRAFLAAGGSAIGPRNPLRVDFTLPEAPIELTVVFDCSFPAVITPVAAEGLRPPASGSVLTRTLRSERNGAWIGISGRDLGFVAVLSRA